MAQEEPEAFPSLTPIQTEANAPARTDANSPSTPKRPRGPSMRESFLTSSLPLGMWHATGEVSSKIPTLPEIKNGAFSAEGWSHEGQLEKRGANPHDIHRRRVARTSSASTRTRKSSITPATPTTPAIAEETREFFPRRGSVSVRDTVVEEVGAEETEAA